MTAKKKSTKTKPPHTVWVLEAYHSGDAHTVNCWANDEPDEDAVCHDLLEYCVSSLGWDDFDDFDDFGMDYARYKGRRVRYGLRSYTPSAG